MGYGQWVHVHVDRIKKETEKAFLCEIDGEEVWLPVSQIANPEDYSEGDEDLTLSVTEWIAREKDLETE